jgi:hypothetical protein
MKVCPDCSEEVEDDDWAPETQGSGAQPGVCLECAEYYRNCQDQFEDEFESSLQCASAESEVDFDEDANS